MNITFITGNAKKAEQLGRYLNHPVDHLKLDLTEIQSLDIEEVAKHKVLEAYRRVKEPILIDDNSLIINAFGQLPGTLIKWFGEEIGFNKFPELLKAFSDKSALAIVAIAFYDGSELKIFIGEEKGQISEKALGTNGFGWDTVFIPDGHTKTRAQMDDVEYDLTSPRKKALEKLKEYLDGQK
jgi:non-canonical purine NTP pyrophosphatase (RdgB/HAM1 family)